MTDRLDASIRLGFAFALVLLGASSVRMSVGAPLLQGIVLCASGAVFVTGGGAYVLRWL